jgi:hypothetical protein
VTAGFEAEIVVEALDSLLTRNPRNPFRPSPQDVVERCRKVEGQWRDQAENYYLGRADDPPPQWAAALVADVLRSRLSLWAAYYRDGRADYRSVTEADFRGYRIAKAIGPRIGEWPAHLLDEFGVLRGHAYERVADAIAAEEEECRRRERRRSEWATAQARTRSTMPRCVWDDLSNTERQRKVMDEVARDPGAFPELANGRAA